MWIESPDVPQLDQLSKQLADSASQLDTGELAWPQPQLDWCAQQGVYRWFLPEEWGGAAWSDADVIRGYLKLSAGCLTTTFIITQFTGACRRIAASNNEALKVELLPKLARGELFATVGISHLTTSRRHLKKPVLQAERVPGGFQLNGMAPWVTGSLAADVIVIGASLDDGTELLAAVPATSDGIEIATTPNLVALTASQTGAVKFKDCFLHEDKLIAGPVAGVMKQGVGARTGGVQTSTLAVGLATAAVELMRTESAVRPELVDAMQALSQEVDRLTEDVIRTASGETICSNEELRTRANSLALRSTQAALTAAKGSGFVIGHPAGRWCREALFFLVWSCPQPVMAANLCELAGLTD